MLGVPGQGTLVTVMAIPLIAVFGFSLGAFASWRVTTNYKDAHYTAIMESQRATAENSLRVAHEQARAAETKVRGLMATQEKEHAQRQKTHDALLAENTRLAGELGGLRDPGRRPACRTPVPSPGGAPVTPVDDPADGRLSTEATAFLLNFARECDRAAEYAIATKAYADTLYQSCLAQPPP